MSEEPEKELLVFFCKDCGFKCIVEEEKCGIEECNDCASTNYTFLKYKLSRNGDE